MQCGDVHEAGTCIYQAEYLPQGNCKSVMEVLIVANSVHEEDAGSHEVESHRRVHGGPNRRAAHGRSWLLCGRHGTCMIGRLGRR